ncbi:MAG: ECF subfamily RNA polymerase sigma factor, BldN family [Sporichthyaceae bacterium]
MFRSPFDAAGLDRLRAAVRTPALVGLSPALAGGYDGGPVGGHTLLNAAANTAPGVLGIPAPAGPMTGAAAAEGPDLEARRVAQLVESAKAGNTDAFARLYDRYVDTIHRYVYYRVGSRQLAEDLTSETFLRALRRIDTFTWQGRDFGAWLVTIARNLVADHFKSSRFRLEITTAEMIDSDSAEEGPEGAVMASFTNTALLEAVQRLNSAQQECLVLRFLQGLSVAETARIMGKNEGAIKTLQYRAVRALAQLLPEDVR